ncbi:MAG: T9SS type A sorting domain-containing protein, partial [Bacteroidales bacterium]|nr:T9SS type A sorting domain-containing protein [Bacteroidales bacterium]
SLDIVIEAGAEDAYYCIITNECASVSTDTAIITGMTSPIITSHPIDNIVCAGNDAEFACKASGTEPLSYRWLFNDATLVFANAVGEETNTVQLNNAYLGQAGLYSCFVYNQCGSTTSDEAELTINSLPFINLQADDIVVCEGEEINIAVPIIGTEPITYQWIYLETDEEISTDSTFIIQNITKEQEGNYYLILENICGAVSSDTFNITVNTYPNILSVPEDILTCEGESIDFGIEYEGTEPFEFLWYRNNSAISTETNAEINIASAHSGHTGAYFCKISNICGELDSETFNVLVGTHPSIQWSSGDKYLCENDTLLLELSPNGEVLFFEWTLNGDIIPNANDSILLIPLVNASQAGEYQGRVFNECSEVFTNIINVNISVAPELDLGPDIEVCEGTTLTLSPEGDFNSYLWNDGESTAPWLDVAESGIYFVKVLGDNGCYNYDTVQVTFHPLVFVDLGEDFANCGSTEISGPDGAYSYLWSNGSTEQTILVSESNTYWLKTLGSEFGCESSDTINIIIDEIPSIDLGADHVIAEDSSINIGVDAIYHSYMWNNGFNGPVQTFVGSELTLGSHKIWLRVATEHNCTASDTVYITVIPAQSIASFDDANKISIYPNPVKDYLHIQSDLFQSESCVINLLDIQGRKIMEFTENYGEKNHWLIDCSALKSGLYFVEINLEGGSRFVKKLSVQ